MAEIAPSAAAVRKVISAAGSPPSARARAIGFMPTGGISPQNLGAYLALPNVFCCGGSWLAPQSKMDDTARFRKGAGKGGKAR